MSNNLAKFYLFRAFNNPPEPTVPPPTPPTPPKTFTQEEVNKLMEENRKGLQLKAAEQAKQLEELSKTLNMTADQKADMESKIEELRNASMTKEQQAATEFEKFKKKAESEAKALHEQAQTWHNRFATVLVDNAITQAAVKHNAFNAEQLADMLKSKVKLVELKDDNGAGIGQFEVRLPTKTINPKTKEELVLDLTVDEGVGKLRENEAYQNLFKDTSKGGFGGGPPNSGGGASTYRPGMSMEEYMKNREKIKNG